MSAETLEKEHLARYCINYASYLIDVGKYLEALENLETAAETTGVAKTRTDALLSKATLLASFLDAPEQALKVYQDLAQGDDPAAEIAAYREGFLLFDLQRFEKARASLARYRKRFPEGRFRFQAEALEKRDRQANAAFPPRRRHHPHPHPHPLQHRPRHLQPTPPPVEKPEPPMLRVRVAYTTKDAQITGSTLVCAKGVGCKQRFTLRVKGGQLLVNGVNAPTVPLVFKSEQPLTIITNKKEKKLRGHLVASIRSGKLLVNNVVDIEDYLLSVVPSENPASWPIETLKAQAVAARTYAYYQLLHRKTWAYDLVDYAGDQAYGGMAKEHSRSTQGGQRHPRRGVDL